MDHEIEVPDTPQQAVELWHQDRFDSAIKGITRLMADREYISAHNCPVKPSSVIAIIDLALTLGYVSLLHCEREHLREDQVAKVQEAAEILGVEI